MSVLPRTGHAASRSPSVSVAVVGWPVPSGKPRMKSAARDAALAARRRLGCRRRAQDFQRGEPVHL